MIIFLYGEDTFRAKQKLNEIIEQHRKVHKSGLNLKYLDFSKKEEDLSFSGFKDEIRQTSMFNEKKLVIIINSFSNSPFKEAFLEEEKDFADDIILFYEEGKVDKRDSLFKFLKENAKCQEFSLLRGSKLKAWIKKELGSCKAEPAVFEKLVDYVGSDLWRLNNELKKLVSFRNGKEIKAQDVDFLIRPKIETDIFKTIDALAQKDKKGALELLHKHLEKGDSPSYLFSMINFQFRNLLMVKELAERRSPYNVILRKSGLHPFVMKKNYFQSQKFTLPELKKIYQRIFQIDFNIKTGQVEPGAALDVLIAEI